MTYELAATYSPEDNKLRLYANNRLDTDLYTRVKEMGFKWAPKQDLFVAPRWTPLREDFCLELAGEITPEQSTMLERAEEKSDRLDTIAGNKARQANVFEKAAEQISKRFAYGQPILVGHHSERKARKDQERMHNATDKAVSLTKSISYWHDRADGTIRHANRKNSPAVICRRIKTLLKELRDHQRTINHGNAIISIFERFATIEDKEEQHRVISKYVGSVIDTGYLSPEGTWSKLTNGEITHEQALQITLDYGHRLANSINAARWINHVLNRLNYERSALGVIPLYTGELTAVILQTFAREQGAYKPKATLEHGVWSLMSSITLPAHLTNGEAKAIEKTPAELCKLMQSVGYRVPAPKARRKSTNTRVPLINPTLEEAEKLQAAWNTAALKKHASQYSRATPMEVNEVKQITQAQYSVGSKGDYGRYDTIELDENGHKIWISYKGKSGIPVCRIRVSKHGGSSLYAPSPILVLTDKPNKSLPISINTETVAE